MVRKAKRFPAQVQRLQLALMRALPGIRRSARGRSNRGGGKYMGCFEMADEIARWFLREHDLDVAPVQGYFQGVDDWYHWWTEAIIDGETWIVDATRHQLNMHEARFAPAVFWGRKAEHAHDYQTEVAE